MSATVISLNSRKATNMAMLGVDLPIRLILVPVDGVEPLDEVLHQPLIAFIMRWLRCEFGEMGDSFLTKPVAIKMMTRILDQEPFAVHVKDLAKHKIKRIGHRYGVGGVHWYYDVGGMLALGQVTKTGFVASVTYHPLVAGYYVKLPNHNGEIGVLRILD